ncbi:N-acetyltransferase [Macrococcus hajekii]|uniref:GNAT family N-acetyltransferase n=1 Tax=Macrococcus hajekii TaxID=198482 RepID=UPI001997D7B4|nr:GNAT family N-acetyltransferase [Macrococcus hajekii]GGB03631.1 N-acetyltransferase [Macrococcus hajekii]
MSLTFQQNEFNIAISRATQSDLEDIKSHYINPGGQFWIAVNELNDIIGCVGLVRLSHENSALKKMFVNSDYRNLKIGKQLLDTVIKKAKQDGIKAIYLGTIDKFISAQYFYSNNGFTEILKTDLPDDFPVIDVDNRFYFQNI